MRRRKTGKARRRGKEEERKTKKKKGRGRRRGKEEEKSSPFKKAGGDPPQLICILNV